MKILCHVGPWCVDQFAAIANGFSKDSEIRFVSGFRKLDQTGLVSAYYKYVNATGSRLIIDERDAEVISRCRLLRSLPDVVAGRHAAAMRLSMREMLLREKPDVIICESVDQYLHDILFQEAESLKILRYGLIRTFVNNYFRISTRGEMQLIRQPDDSEVSQTLRHLLDDTYIPKNLLKLKKNLFFTYFRIYFSNHARVVYFSILKHLKREPYNYHYWSSSRTTRKLYAHLIPKISFGHSDWKSRLAKSQKPVIFIPLQHFPEATVDYWAEDIEMVDYPNRLIELINILSKDFQILIKEHPGVWGFRKPTFYKNIEAAASSLVICPAEVTGQECILVCDSVLVWTGSVGFEAALRGKPVLTTCTPYYAIGPRFKKISLKTDIKEIFQFIERYRQIEISQEEQIELIHNLLCGLLPGHFQNNGTFDHQKPSHVAAANQVGKHLRVVYEKGKLHSNHEYSN